MGLKELPLVSLDIDYSLNNSYVAEQTPSSVIIAARFQQIKYTLYVPFTDQNTLLFIEYEFAENIHNVLNRANPAYQMDGQVEGLNLNAIYL